MASPGCNGEIHGRCAAGPVPWRFRALRARFGERDDAAKGRKKVDEKALEAIRRVIREEVPPMIREEVRPIIREEVRPIIQEEVRPIIREEVRPIIQEEVRPMFREELQPIEKRLDRLECKTDAIHRDLMTLRVELRGVIDPDFPALGATEE